MAVLLGASDTGARINNTSVLASLEMVKDRQNQNLQLPNISTHTNAGSQDTGWGEIGQHMLYQL